MKSINSSLSTKTSILDFMKSFSWLLTINGTSSHITLQLLRDVKRIPIVDPNTGLLVGRYWNISCWRTCWCIASRENTPLVLFRCRYAIRRKTELWDSNSGEWSTTTNEYHYLLRMPATRIAKLISYRKDFVFLEGRTSFPICAFPVFVELSIQLLRAPRSFDLSS